MEAARPAAEGKQITVESDFDSKSVTVFADPQRLRQIVWNLLSNAVKFTPEGGRVEVRASERESQIEITVSDTGRGIDPDFLPYVFDRFRQAEASTTRKHGGLGLGLAIVRHLVELHGGTVRAHSEGRDRGATFTVELPVMPLREAIVEHDGAGRELLELQTVPGHLAGVRVLVVDDHTDSGELIGMVLEQAGAVVQLARSAEEALAYLRQASVHVLVSDLSMPGMDGYQLLGAVRAMERIRGRDPVSAVALTAYAGGEDRARALAIGFQAFASKPIEPAELIDLVAKTMDGREHRVPDDL
jgi:CheY-like chemotaxis protein